MAQKILKKSEKILTGRKVLIILLISFGIVFAVNGYMVYLAMSEFRNVKIQNTYQRGRTFQKSAEEQVQQNQLGWSVRVDSARLGASQKVITMTVLDQDNQPIEGVNINAHVENPVNESGDRPVLMSSSEPGIFQGAIENLHDGQWVFVFDIVRDGQKLYSDGVKLVFTP